MKQSRQACGHRPVRSTSRGEAPELQIMLVACPRNHHYLHVPVIVRRPLISPTSKGSH